MDSSRRDFLKKLTLLGAGVMLNPFSRVVEAAQAAAEAGPGAAASGGAKGGTKGGTAAARSLKGFIVSDAHFGWTGADQPTVETQRQMMKSIMENFPDLDLFIDTGDAHHGNVGDQARGDWTDVIQGGCGTAPFYYVMGNHEQKVESRCNTFGSNECRPYYSFDRMGIHFISLPEMMDHSYITDTEFAWLKLDLELHKDMTTIAFSHNSLKGTTEYFNDRGYRQLTNSDAMLELFRLYPNVIAWMHGHNHTYEVVPKFGNLYVSNGRIGGFDPKAFGDNYGAGNLGGIYFEVTGDGLWVRCFSATQNKFFDQTSGGNIFTHKLARSTTFDPAGLPAYSCGFGGSPSGQELETWHHHLGGTRTLYLTGAANPIINENHDLKVYVQRSDKRFMQKILSGYAMLPNEENKIHVDSTWDWIDPGVRIYKRATAEEQKGIFVPNHNYSYFLCSPGEKYTLSAVIRSASAGRVATPVCRFFGGRGGDDTEMIYEDKGTPITLRGGVEERSWSFDVPALAGTRSKKGILYDNPHMKMSIGVMFSNLTEDVDVLSFRFQLAEASDNAKTIDPVLTIDKKKVSYNGILAQGEVRRFDLDEAASPSSARGFEVKGNSRVTWLEKRSAPKYQVRNAAGYYADGTYVIGPLRNKFSQREEIVIAPMVRTSLPYLHRTRGIDTFTFREEAGSTEVEVRSLTHGGLSGEIDFISPRPPRQVIGTENYRYADNTLTVTGKIDKISILW